MKEKIKNFLARFDKKTIIIATSGIVGLIVVAIIISAVLNKKASTYTTLFSKTNKDDATQIVNLLNDNNIPYKFENDGDILVQKNEKDKAMALVAMNAYPSSGFAYEITGKAGSMATDSDKRRYAVYDLQNRIGSTIRMFDGVQDAKVTIAIGEQNKYVLSEDEDIPASASVLVKMKDGGSPTVSQVIGIQRLLSKSIRGISMENVAVIDGNGKDVSVVVPEDESNDGRTAGAAAAGSVAELQSDIAGVIEKHIADNVKAVFNPLYGNGNVSVVARADINIETVMREAISYSVPEEIDKQDKRGLIARESGQGGGSLYPPGAEGVVGTEVNSDVTEYNARTDKGNTDVRGYEYAREYLVNQVKEQGSIPAGSVKDLSLSISINTDNTDIAKADLVNLAGNAAGIPLDQREAKITIVYGKFNTGAPAPVPAPENIAGKIPYWLWAVIGAVLLLIVLLVAYLLYRRRKLLLALQLEAINAEAAGTEGMGMPPVGPGSRIEEDEEQLFMQDDRGMGLRKDVRDFADKNPEIAARLLKSWLTGGEENA